MESTKIIVLTPVKNEAWILDRFLSVTSQFADRIIIADQNSTDGSLEIYKKYPKVHLINNKDSQYDEASRQLLLLKTARELEPDAKRILLAFDADEVLTADSVTNPGWKTMLDSKPGTVLFFEKPDLYIDTNKAIRYSDPWPLGYVDDGVEHKPLKIHSIRVPQPEYADKLYLDDVKIMHYTLTRINAQNSKLMYYSMLENVYKKNHFLARRRIYVRNFDYVNKNKLEATPAKWFEGWEKLGIDMRTISTETKFWYEDEALKLFSEYGSKKFWLDNIWDNSWAKLAKESGLAGSISSPPKLLSISLNVLDKLYEKFRKLSQN